MHQKHPPAKVAFARCFPPAGVAACLSADTAAAAASSMPAMSMTYGIVLFIARPPCHSLPLLAPVFILAAFPCRPAYCPPLALSAGTPHPLPRACQRTLDIQATIKRLTV